MALALVALLVAAWGAFLRWPPLRAEITALTGRPSGSQPAGPAVPAVRALPAEASDLEGQAVPEVSVEAATAAGQALHPRGLGTTVSPELADADGAPAPSPSRDESPAAAAPEDTAKRATAPRRPKRRAAAHADPAQPSTRTPSARPSPPAGAAAPAAPAVTQGLTRDQVLAGFKRAKPAVAACAEGEGGSIARVRARILGSGRVSYALVKGYYAGSQAGSCMALAMRKARFPAFSGDPIVVEFPYQL